MKPFPCRMAGGLGYRRESVPTASRAATWCAGWLCCQTRHLGRHEVIRVDAINLPQAGRSIQGIPGNADLRRLHADVVEMGRLEQKRYSG